MVLTQGYSLLDGCGTMGDCAGAGTWLQVLGRLVLGIRRGFVGGFYLILGRVVFKYNLVLLALYLLFALAVLFVLLVKNAILSSILFAISADSLS